MGASTTWRAVVAVSMLLGFYLFAFGIVTALIVLNYAVFQAGAVIYYLFVTTFVVAYVVLRAVFFVGDRVEPPAHGALVTPDHHPDLFTVVDEIARRMGTSRPDETYLTPDVNAGVVEDTRLLGLISRGRIMFIGVGLLNTLTVDELRSILAHEFGHYAASDTRLSAIVYRGRASIHRALEAMEDGPIRLMFEWYASVYESLSLATSRSQEFAADAWAAHIGGPEATTRALATVPEAAASFSILLSDYVSPMASQGYLPVDLYEGLRALRSSPARLAQIAAEHDVPPQPEPFDTHPPTADRIAALNDMDPVGHVADRRPARDLLRDPEQVERLVTRKMYRSDKEWEFVEWEDAGSPLGVSQQVAGVQIFDMTWRAGNVGRTDIFEMLRNGDLETVRARMGFDPNIPPEVLPMVLRPYVYAAVAYLLGDAVEWDIDWDGPAPISTASHDIGSLVDALLVGGPQSEAAYRELVAIRKS